MSTHHLQALFKPRSVALAGASARPGSLGRAVLDAARRELFAQRSDGSLFPVEIGLNPMEVDGAPAGRFINQRNFYHDTK